MRSVVYKAIQGGVKYPRSGRSRLGMASQSDTMLGSPDMMFRLGIEACVTAIRFEYEMNQLMKPVYTLEDLRLWQENTAGIEPPIRLAVTGDPIIHSASPFMHNAALALLGIPAQYTRLHLRPDELAEGLSLLASNGFIGLNVTIPHKTAILPLLNRVDDHARQIGAVNTVAFEDGNLVGYNTDGPGLVRAIRAEFGVELRDLRVLVLGAGGGAGKAISVQCAIEGCKKLVLANRTVEKAEVLAGELSRQFAGAEVSATDLEEATLRREIAEIDLVINATSVGMKPGDPSPLAASLLRPGLRVYDTIYTANRTPLMLAADEAGAESANGFSMLLHQGALAFEIWFKREAPLEVMREALLRK